MNLRVRLLLICCYTFCITHGFAQFRKYSNEFLNIGAGAKALGMGGAYVATADDANAGYWNAAGLAYINEHPAITFMHAEYFAGIGKYDYLAGAFPVDDNSKTLGISLLRFGVDDIPNTLYLVEPDGSVNYNNIQTFSSADYALLLSYSQFLKDNENAKLSWGANTKIIHRKVGSFASAWGFGFDAGFMYRTPTWRFGAAARDVTTTFNAWSFSFTDEEKEALYLTNNDIPEKSTELTSPRLVLGGGYNFTFSEKFHLLAEADLDVTFDGKRNTVLSSNPISIDPKIGVEANIHNIVFVRAGASNFQRALKDGDTLNQQKVWIFQPAVGAGFKVGNVGIDYAFTNLANQSNPLYTHIFSLTVDLISKNKEKTAKSSSQQIQRTEKKKRTRGAYPVI